MNTYDRLFELMLEKRLEEGSLQRRMRRERIAAAGLPKGSADPKYWRSHKLPGGKRLDIQKAGLQKQDRGAILVKRPLGDRGRPSFPVDWSGRDYRHVPTPRGKHFAAHDSGTRQGITNWRGGERRTRVVLPKGAENKGQLAGVEGKIVHSTVAKKSAGAYGTASDNPIRHQAPRRIDRNTRITARPGQSAPVRSFPSTWTAAGARENETKEEKAARAARDEAMKKEPGVSPHSTKDVPRIRKKGRSPTAPVKASDTSVRGGSWGHRRAEEAEKEEDAAPKPSRRVAARGRLTGKRAGASTLTQAGGTGRRVLTAPQRDARDLRRARQEARGKDVYASDEDNLKAMRSRDASRKKANKKRWGPNYRLSPP